MLMRDVKQRRETVWCLRLLVVHRKIEEDLPKSDIDLKQVKEPPCLFGGRSFQPAEMALTKVLREEHSWHI